MKLGHLLDYIMNVHFRFVCCGRSLAYFKSVMGVFRKLNAPFMLQFQMLYNAVITTGDVGSEGWFNQMRYFVYIIIITFRQVVALFLFTINKTQPVIRLFGNHSSRDNFVFWMLQCNCCDSFYGSNKTYSWYWPVMMSNFFGYWHTLYFATVSRKLPFSFQEIWGQ